MKGEEMTGRVGRMDGMSDLAEFLLARIAEDEAAYRGAMHMGCVEDDSDGPNVIHSATCPARVLAECDAKRRIVADCVAMYDRDAHIEDRGPDLADYVLADLALPYAEHPDYQPPGWAA